MNMSRLSAILAAVLALAGCALGPGAYDLVNDGKNTDNVLTYGMGYGQNRYSPLEQINKTNVKRLVPVWSLSLENDFGEQAQPMILDGVMYVSDAKWTVAIDAVTDVAKLRKNAADVIDVAKLFSAVREGAAA